MAGGPHWASVGAGELEAAKVKAKEDQGGEPAASAFLFNSVAPVLQHAADGAAVLGAAPGAHVHVHQDRASGLGQADARRGAQHP